MPVSVTGGPPAVVATTVGECRLAAWPEGPKPPFGRGLLWHRFGPVATREHRQGASLVAPALSPVQGVGRPNHEASAGAGAL